MADERGEQLGPPFVRSEPRNAAGRFVEALQVATVGIALGFLLLSKAAERASDSFAELTELLLQLEEEEERDD
jgi:hypothetical protein